MIIDRGCCTAERFHRCVGNKLISNRVSRPKPDDGKFYLARSLLWENNYPGPAIGLAFTLLRFKGDPPGQLVINQIFFRHIR